MKYKIEKAQWGNAKHSWVNVLVIELDNSDSEIDRFNYVAIKEDAAPLNRWLWEQLENDPGIIQESEETLILTGRIPLPEGKTIIGQHINDDRQMAAEIRNKVDQQLAELSSPRNIARAELDKEFAKKRREQMRLLLAVEEQEGFPYEVEWPEVL